MKEYHNLPVQFNERIQAFSVDMIPLFLTTIIVIFMQVNLELKITIITFVFFEFNIFPSHIKKGSSLGKFTSGIKVVNEDYTEVSLIKMYGREIFIFGVGILTAGLYFVLAFYLLGKRKDKRSIHDLIFKTKVIYVDPYVDNR